MIDLEVLGGLDFAGLDDATAARARRRHPLMLMALLAASAPQAMSRERIMALLWPESDANRASASLRQALYGLRQDLGEELFLADSVAGLRIDPAHVRVDLWTFREAIARGAYRDAVDAHRGPFLDGVQTARLPEFSRWLESEREAIELAYGAALDALAREAEERQCWDEAVVLRRRQAAHDPYSSRVALALLQALVAAGDRPGALEYARVYEGVLRTQLEIGPDPAVVEFIAGVRLDTPAEPAAVVVEPTRLPPGIEHDAVRLPPAIPQLPTRTRGRWMIAAGLIGLMGIGAGWTALTAAPDPDPVLVLGSGMSTLAGRDTMNRLVACDGPACPAGALPQAAWVVPTHVAFTRAPDATHYIAPVPDGTTQISPGYSCCTIAVFEQEFRLPPETRSAMISLSILADNQAIVEINGVEFGRHGDKWSVDNYAGQPATFATSFAPAPEGINRLRVTLWDGGGALGMSFRALVASNWAGEADR